MVDEERQGLCLGWAERRLKMEKIPVWDTLPPSSPQEPSRRTFNYYAVTDGDAPESLLSGYHPVSSSLDSSPLPPQPSPTAHDRH